MSTHAQLHELMDVRDRCIGVGVCPNCRSRLAVTGKTLCVRCGTHQVQRARKRIDYRGKRKCGICRRRGHDRRTCQSPKAANYWSDSASGPSLKKAVRT